MRPAQTFSRSGDQHQNHPKEAATPTLQTLGKAAHTRTHKRTLFTVLPEHSPLHTRSCIQHTLSVDRAPAYTQESSMLLTAVPCGDRTPDTPWGACP
jgi:hypothetical protein